MNLAFRKFSIIYGPVYSRRLGKSLGINLLGIGEKICTFDCKYCERGWTEKDNFSDIDCKNIPKVSDVAEALEEALENIHIEPEHFTFSGNGEPTLHPEFTEIVDEVIRIRNEKSPKTKIAILSNSTTLNKPEIINLLDKLDERIMKLDTGNEEMFKVFNSPLNITKLCEVVEGIKRLNNITIQSLFAKGSEGNYTMENINDWVEILKVIKPNYVQLYTLDRGYPSDNIFPLEYEELINIESLLKKNGINVKVY
jgi:wyosine [tRNA(Phe)-imidazoG37] synthetase (radical SAM superfamily)